jgi:voltage-gated potassium channel
MMVAANGAPGSSTARKLGIALGLFGLVLLVGVIGFKTLIPEHTWIEAIFMTVITLSTVGYTEVHPFGQVTMVFASLLIFGGVASGSLVLALAAGTVVEDVISLDRRKRRMEREIEHLRNHYVICGFGGMGSTVAETFRREKIPFVAVEISPDVVEENRRSGDYIIQGDATHDEILEAAGIKSARCLVAATASDADNLFITLSARQLNPGLLIVARAEDETTTAKLRRAGADRVVMPRLMGAHRVANAALRPRVIDFMEAMTGGTDEFGFRFEELVVGDKSEIAGRTLGSLNLARRVGVIIASVLRESGEMQFNPTAETKLHPGDTLIAMGTAEHFKKLRDML